jgi:hypothetical protein
METSRPILQEDVDFDIKEKDVKNDKQVELLLRKID